MIHFVINQAGTFHEVKLTNNSVGRLWKITIKFLYVLLIVLKNWRQNTVWICLNVVINPAKNTFI